jgi:transposase-like protein
MSRNPIQFQKGLSLSEFQRRYGSEARCEAALKAWRWPDGFVCPHCGCRDHAIVGQRRLHLCHGCRRQTSLKAGTIFAKTLLPLTKWLQAMFLITQSKNSISSLELSRQLGVKYDSAWLMRQKLNAVMQADEESRKLDGRIEMDDAVLGGEKGELEGGKRGRGGPNKIPFVVAVATSDEGRPQRLALMPVAAHNRDEIARIAKLHLAPSARVVSDGLACFAAVTKAGCLHEPVVVSQTLTGRSETLICFRWVNTVLGNLKTAIRGTCHAIRRPYVPRYLAEFQWRFNRRFDLRGMLDNLAAAAIRQAPTPYQAIRIAHVDG